MPDEQIAGTSYLKNTGVVPLLNHLIEVREGTKCRAMRALSSHSTERSRFWFHHSMAMANCHFLLPHISHWPWVWLRWERKQNAEQRELFPSISLRETDFWFHQFHSHGKLPFSLMVHISLTMGQIEVGEKAKCGAMRAHCRHLTVTNKLWISLFHGHGKLLFSSTPHISQTVGPIEMGDEAKCRAMRGSYRHHTERNRLFIPPLPRPWKTAISSHGTYFTNHGSLPEVRGT